MSLRDLSPEAFDSLTRETVRRFAISRRRMMLGSAALAAGLGLPRIGFGQEPQPGGVMRVGRAEEPDTLDPHNTTLSVSSMTMDLIYEPLARLDYDNNLVPGLAESWEFTNENRTLVFTLKPGALFHDGTPMDAEAVAWTVARHIDPDNASPSMFFLGPIEGAEVIDDLTVAYHYSDPFVPVWVGLTLGYCAPISPAAVEALGDRFGREPVGGGPFRFVSWSPDRGLRMERNEDYGPINPPPALDAVEFTHYPEDSTRIAAFETGEINAIFHGSSVPLDAVRRLRGNPDLELIERPAQMMRALVFNQSREPFDNPEVRKAFAHAVDIDRIIAFALDGQAARAVSPIASAIPGFNPDVEAAGYAYDPDRAREILEAEGYGDGLSVTLLCNDTAVIRRTAEVVQAQLGEIGVEVTIESMPIAQWSAVSSQGNHDMVISTYSYPDADVVFTALHSTGSLTRTFADNPELDALIAEQRITVDEDARQALLDEIQTIVVSEAYWKPLFEPLNFAVIDTEIQGAILTGNGIIRADLVWMT